MAKIGIVYTIIGIVAIIGAAVAAYLIINMAMALSIINTTDASQLPPDVDLAALQESMGYFNLIIALGSIWVISVFLAGLLCVRMGVRALRARTKAYAGR